VQLSLRTVFSISVFDFKVAALNLDLPAFNLDVESRANVLANCQTPPAGTPSDRIYSELTSFHGNLFAELSYDITNDTRSIKKWEIWDNLNKCYAFFPGLGHIGSVPDSPKSALLTAAAVTTCTTDGVASSATLGAVLGALSPGAKAGAVIGEFIIS
jgi:hypothetical protein